MHGCARQGLRFKAVHFEKMQRCHPGLQSAALGYRHGIGIDRVSKARAQQIGQRCVRHVGIDDDGTGGPKNSRLALQQSGRELLQQRHVIDGEFQLALRAVDGQIGGRGTAQYGLNRRHIHANGSRAAQ